MYLFSDGVDDFLKELHLTEDRGTDIPKIKRAMKLNGSLRLDDTDDDLSYFLTILPYAQSQLRNY